MRKGNYVLACSPKQQPPSIKVFNLIRMLPDCIGGNSRMGEFHAKRHEYCPAGKQHTHYLNAVKPFIVQ